MKGRIVIAALLLTAFTACYKKIVNSQAKESSANKASNILLPDNIYASSWQPISAWSETGGINSKTLSFIKEIPELKNGNDKKAVMVFVRNLWEVDTEFSEDTEFGHPMVMPFHFLPSRQNPSYSEQWEYKSFDSKIDIQLTVKGAGRVELPKKVQYQYIVIPESFLAQKHLSLRDVQQLSYTEIRQLFGIDSLESTKT